MTPPSSSFFVDSTHTYQASASLTWTFVSLPISAASFTMKIKLLRLLTMAFFAVASTLAQNCSVCKDGSAVPNPSLPLALPDIPQLANTTCGIVESGISMFPLDSTTCTGLVGAANLDFLCGCPGSVQLCSLCPNGTPPGNPDLSFPGLNVTCTDIDDGLAFLGETSCSKISANISIFQELCGCPGVMPSCPLCEDGSMIPDPTFPVLGADFFTCGGLQLFPTNSTEECTALQASGGVYWYGHSISMAFSESNYPALTIFFSSISTTSILTVGVTTLLPPQVLVESVVTPLSFLTHHS